MSTATEQEQSTASESISSQVHLLDALDESQVIINPLRNSRGFTPEIGDKSLSDLMADIVSTGLRYNDSPCFATATETGAADIYAGFRRARSIQTLERARLESDKALKPGDPDTQPYLLRVIITDTVMNEQDLFERSLAENVIRRDMTFMQRVAALERLTSEPFNLPLSQAGKKMNLSKGAASTYLRCSLLPANAKKALDNGTMGYASAERYIAMLPKRDDIAADESGELLSKAQAKIQAAVEKELARGNGRVKAASVEASTRKLGDAEGKGPANKTQRNTKTILAEVEEAAAAIPEDQRPESWEYAALVAFGKFASGGSMKQLRKVLRGEA